MLVEYTQLKQPKNPLNFHALTEIARYFEREFRYSVPPKTPFVGEDFNATKAGIHADGLLKHEDIYNSVDTNKVFMMYQGRHTAGYGQSRERFPHAQGVAQTEFDRNTGVFPHLIQCSNQRNYKTKHVGTRDIFQMAAG